jgi:phosphatidylglycerophosphatase A
MNASVKRKPAISLASALATFGGSGLLPIAPGTWGTFASLPLIFGAKVLLIHFGLFVPHLYILMGFALLLVSSWAAGEICQELRTADAQCIVIDETMGFWVAAFLAPPQVTHLVVIGLLFRFFDILKLPPVRWIDGLSKQVSFPASRSGRFIAGSLVVLDDVVAGLQALVVYWILAQYWQR